MMNEELSIYSIEEFISHCGEPQHYLGRACYCWKDVEFPNDWDGREPPTVRHVLFRCGDHSRVLSKKLRIKEWSDRVAALQRCSVRYRRWSNGFIALRKDK